MTKIIKYDLQRFDLIPEEWKGGLSEKQGAIDQLLIDSMVLNHAKQDPSNFSTAWIYFQKAFDLIPHK